MSSANGNSEPISAIYGRETQQGSWSGGGIMLGTGGLGLGIGSGDVSTQTVRAEAFAPPSVSVLSELAPGFFMLVIAFAMQYLPIVVSMMGLSPVEGQDSTRIDMIFLYAQPFMFGLAAVAFVWGIFKLIGPSGQKAFADAKALDAKQMAVYNRLRLDPSVNRVIDPVTGKSSAVDRESVLALIADAVSDPHFNKAD